MGNEIALFGDKEAGLPSYMSQDRDLGNENTSADTLGTPTIKLLQALSPEIRAVEGAQVGKLYDNVSNKVYDDILACNLYFDRKFTVWKDRDFGGGKEGDFDTEAEALEHVQSLDYPEQYQVQETHIHTLIQFKVTDNALEVVGPARLYFKASGLTPSRNWNTELNKLKGPRFCGIWKLYSITQRNKRNEEWANWAFNFEGYVPDQDLYAQLKASYEAVAGVTAQAA